VPRYNNGLHREFYYDITENKDYEDNRLFASTAFIYKNNDRVVEYMSKWWLWQSRYYTVDQLAQTYATSLVEGLKVKTINEHLFKIGYLSLVSHH
jgi:hypothetical protein